MKVKAQCIECNILFEIPNADVGLTITCPSCEKRLRIVAINEEAEKAHLETEEDEEDEFQL
ncbi:hypothetical protein HY570_00945 [Candidatus Micrarchaeota archaeon]|nr:hypothetical protein [Candidatus Micrarchaeota archaeon]